MPMRRDANLQNTHKAHRQLGDNLDRLTAEMNDLRLLVAQQKRQVLLTEKLLQTQRTVIDTLQRKVAQQASTIEALEKENHSLKKKLPYATQTAGLFASPKRLETVVVSARVTVKPKPAWR